MKDPNKPSLIRRFLSFQLSPRAQRILPWIYPSFLVGAGCAIGWYFGRRYTDAEAAHAARMEQMAKCHATQMADLEKQGQRRLQDIETFNRLHMREIDLILGLLDKDPSPASPKIDAQEEAVPDELCSVTILRDMRKLIDEMKDLQNRIKSKKVSQEEAAEEMSKINERKNALITRKRACAGEDL